MMSDLDLYNHPLFRSASCIIYGVRMMLETFMSKEQAYDWIKTWASGAGDGSE
jgi:hypothetical protein